MPVATTLVRILSCTILGAGLLVGARVVPVYAQVCGDADGSGTVSVSDGVQVLRAAAGLTSVCATAVCDLNVDGSLTLTDAVLALRLAAELPTAATCLPAQAAKVVARTHGLLEVGIGIVQSTSATVSAATVGTSTPCADGGMRISTANGFTDVDCQVGDLLSNGTVSVVAQPGTPDETVTLDGYSVHRFSTGETLVSPATLVFTVSGSTVRVNGTVARMSTLLGNFSDAFMDVVAQGTASAVSLSSGTIVTTVTQGTGGFSHLATLETHIVGPNLAIVLVTFQDRTQQVTIFADHIGLCDSCTSSATCDPELACLPCNNQCIGTPPQRCSVNVETFAAQCPDGLF
jgi:hypothetical protein